MSLIELVRGIQTSDETFEATQRLATHLGKTTCVSADRPGFIVNRVLVSEAWELSCSAVPLAMLCSEGGLLLAGPHTKPLVCSICMNMLPAPAPPRQMPMINEAFFALMEVRAWRRRTAGDSWPGAAAVLPAPGQG
jgi:hypothetical protein